MIPTTGAMGSTTVVNRQHTKGPWTVQKVETAKHGYTDWDTYAVRSPQNVCVATVGDVDRFESERIPANVRLMAAAPELLAALQHLEDAATLIEARWERGDLADAVRSLLVDRDNARAVIALASQPTAAPAPTPTPGA